jgi:LysR family transcriptional activator of mexEF-oprN operon
VSEKHVTRAAERLGTTQPKLSALLARLREEFNDPLLVRTSEGMSPTPCAIELAKLACEISMRLDRIAAPQRQFDPALAESTFTLSMQSSIARFVLPPLMRLLNAEAPGVRIIARSPGSEQLKIRLEEGGCDLAVGYYENLPEALYSAVLFDQNFCCIVSKSHPIGENELTLEHYAGLRHVVFVGERVPSATQEHLIDERLGELGLVRAVGLRVSSLLVTPSVVAATDMIATVPIRLARDAASHWPLRILSPPLTLPNPQIRMIWHERHHRDAAHRWLRDCLHRATRAI